MTPEQSDFCVGVIKPVECIKEGWALIKDEYWLFFALTLIGIMVGGAAWFVLLGPMMVGLFLCLFQRQRGQPVEIGLLFKGFDYFVPSLIVALLKSIPMTLVMTPYFIIWFSVMVLPMLRGNYPSQEESRQMFFWMFGVEMIFFLVIMVVSLLVEFVFIFAFPLVADRNLSAFDAIKLSFRASKANLGGVLGFLILSSLLATVGVLLCIVGVYLYLPIAFAAQAVVYRRVFPEMQQTFASPPPPPASWA